MTDDQSVFNLMTASWAIGYAIGYTHNYFVMKTKMSKEFDAIDDMEQIMESVNSLHDNVARCSVIGLDVMKKENRSELNCSAIVEDQTVSVVITRSNRPDIEVVVSDKGE